MILVAILLVALFVMVEYFGIIAALATVIMSIAAQRATADVSATRGKRVSAGFTRGR